MNRGHCVFPPTSQVNCSTIYFALSSYRKEGITQTNGLSMTQGHSALSNKITCPIRWNVPLPSDQQRYTVWLALNLYKRKENWLGGVCWRATGGWVWGRSRHGGREKAARPWGGVREKGWGKTRAEEAGKNRTVQYAPTHTRHPAPDEPSCWRCLPLPLLLLILLPPLSPLPPDCWSCFWFSRCRLIHHHH